MSKDLKHLAGISKIKEEKLLLSRIIKFSIGVNRFKSGNPAGATSTEFTEDAEATMVLSPLCYATWTFSICCLSSCTSLLRSLI